MASADDERYRVVRIFPDSGDSSIWFADAYPFDYDETGISPELRAAFEEWERYFYKHLDYHRANSPEAQSHHLDEGRRLAKALAAEIGDRFEVELRSDFLQGPIPRYSSNAPATNPEAAAVFSRVSDESFADDVAFQKLKAEIEAGGGGLVFVPASRPRGLRGFLARRRMRRD